MPFDKKLACLPNYQERQSFPWPLVFYIFLMPLKPGPGPQPVRTRATYYYLANYLKNSFQIKFQAQILSIMLN